MSTTPVWMENSGYGNVPPNEQAPHLCQRNPVVDGAIVGKTVEVDGVAHPAVPYIATLREGVKINPTGADQRLLDALATFFGTEDQSEWQGCSDIGWGCNEGLICEPLLAHKTVLRKRRATENPPIEYWKVQNNVPVLNLMMTKRYSRVPISEPEFFWCLDYCLYVNGDVFDIETQQGGVSTAREMVYSIARPTNKAYKYNASAGYFEEKTAMGGNTPIGITDPWMIVSPYDDEGYDLPMGVGDGSGTYFYATLAQDFIPFGVWGPVKDGGVDGCFHIAMPTTGGWSGVGSNKPHMVLSFGSWNDYCSVADNTWALTADGYASSSNYKELLFGEALSTNTMPGYYTDSTGEIVKIVAPGIFSANHENWVTIPINSFLCMDYRIASPDRYASPSSCMFQGNGWCVSDDFKSITTRVNVGYSEGFDVNSQMERGAISLYLRFSYSGNPYDGWRPGERDVLIDLTGSNVLSATIGDPDTDKRDEYGVTDLQFVAEEQSDLTTKTYLKLTVDVLFLYNKSISTVPIYLKTERSDQSLVVSKSANGAITWHPFGSTRGSTIGKYDDEVRLNPPVHV